jgi:hypothetical protein
VGEGDQRELDRLMHPAESMHWSFNPAERRTQWVERGGGDGRLVALRTVGKKETSAQMEAVKSAA